MEVRTVPGVWPDDNISAVVRARASILAEVELERLNLQQRGLREKGRKGGGVKGEENTSIGERVRRISRCRWGG